jgi:NADH-quinone oxidoreductase subunit J
MFDSGNVFDSLKTLCYLCTSFLEQESINPSLPVSLDSVFFFIIAVCAIASALMVVLQRNPVMCAISLIANFFCIALLYLLLKAQLLAVLQVVVYTGAIMVLVVFVIMLLNLGDEAKLTERFDVKKIAGVVLVVGFLLELLYLFALSDSPLFPSPLAEQLGTVEAMGSAMFTRFLLPFEVTSLLLLAAIVGAVVLAKKRS